MPKRPPNKAPAGVTLGTIADYHIKNIAYQMSIKPKFFMFCKKKITFASRFMKAINSISVIGSGNVATHLGLALQAAGDEVRGVYSRTESHAKRLAEALGGAVATDDLQRLPEADAYIFAVKDDALPDLAAEFAALHPHCEALVLHTAGSVPMDVLAKHFKNAGVLYPMQTLSRERKTSMADVHFFVEATNAAALGSITELALRLSPHVSPLDSAGRRTLHLAAVFASNFANHCYALAYELLREKGINPACLLPLIDETAHKAHELDPAEGQTGPAVRGDEAVMRRHEELLANKPEMRSLYRLMSASIAALQEKRK